MLNNDSTAYGAQETMTVPNSETSQSPASFPTAGDYYRSVFAWLSPSRENVSVKCVFHDDHSPSLSLNLTTGAFNCFACKAKGRDIVSFHAKRNHLSHSKASAELKENGFDITRRPASRSVNPEYAEWEQRYKLILLNEEAYCSAVGDLLHRYITETRGIPLAVIPETLRLHPNLHYTDQSGRIVGIFPAMLAFVTDPYGIYCAIHRTYLAEDATKAPVPSPKKLTRATFPGATKGGAIRLFDPRPKMAVAEGIETALAVHAATGLPVWSTVSAGGMESVLLPKEVREVIICVDNDESGRGLHSANILAGRLMREKRNVQLAVPRGQNADWADVFGGQK